MNIAIIPARGGSKRIPHKNIKLFHGKPIITYSIESAFESNVFDKIFVSTDDPEISDIAISLGADIIKRPVELSGDHIGIQPVMSHAAKELSLQNSAINFICCIYATAPFITSKDLIEGLRILKNDTSKVVLAASEYSYPVHRSFFFNESSEIEMLFPQHFNSRSQDLPNIMHDAGLFTWANIDTWQGEPLSFGKRHNVVLIPSWRVQDIDTLEDWKRAELLYQALILSNNLHD